MERTPEQVEILRASRLQKKKDLETKFPKRKIGLVAYKDGREFWIAAPTRQQWHSFKKHLMDPKRKDVASENLVAACSIEPDAEQIQSLFETEPLLVETLSEKLCLLGGRDEEAELVDFPDA